MSEKNKAALQQANAAISQGDIEGFLAYCSEDTQWAMVGDRVLKGKEAVRQWMLSTYHEPPVFSVNDLVAEGDVVIAVGDITVKDSNGKATHYSYSDMWRFRDGKMVALKAFVIEKGEQA